jgi:hypothetical protein
MSDTSTGIGKVVVNRSMSLDGFIAGPGDAMDWVFDFVAPDEFPEVAAATGAMLVGRRTYEVGKRMNASKERGSASSGETYPFSGPVFVLTHEPPESPNPTDPGRSHPQFGQTALLAPVAHRVRPVTNQGRIHDSPTGASSGGCQLRHPGSQSTANGDRGAPGRVETPRIEAISPLPAPWQAPPHHLNPQTMD